MDLFFDRGKISFFIFSPDEKKRNIQSIFGLLSKNN